MASETTNSEELFHFISEYTGDGCALQLLLFFAAHPYARFNELAIIHALNQGGERRSLQKALRGLVDKGIIKTCTDSGALLYSLPENMGNLALELSKRVRQRRQLPRQTPDTTVTRTSPPGGIGVRQRTTKPPLYRDKN